MGDSSNEQPTLDQYIMGQCTRGEVQTPFATGKNMDQMKDMLRNSQPGTVLEVAGAWKRISEALATGGGSIKSTFDQAVSHIMQHWEGDAADGFYAKAKEISKSIQDTATYAEYTSVAMTSAGNVLKKIQPEVMAMQKPSRVSSVLDYVSDGGDRSDAYKSSLDKSDQGGAQNALNKDSGSLSAGKEAQLKMAAKMETLAVAYTSQTATMGSWRKPLVDDRHDYPGDPGGVTPVPVIVSPEFPPPDTGSRRNGGSGATYSGGAKTGSVTSPRTQPHEVGVSHEVGISGGAQKLPDSGKPPIGTSVDGITGGVGGGARVSGGSTGVGVGGSLGPIGGGSAGGTGGAGGAFGAGFGAGAAGAGAAGRGAGGTGSMGRGMPGAGGAGKLGAGLGEAEEGSASRNLARMRGGVVGEAEEGAASKGSQGGSGLHQSRGATGKGETSGKGRNGMMGRGANTHHEEEEEQTGQRPDYLVEDEETWVPNSNVAPRVIE